MKKDIALIILTHNSYSDKCGAIEFVINAYLNQHVLPDEIIVVNNDSDIDNTTKLQQFCNLHPLIKLFSCSLSIGGARNYGAQIAKSHYLLFNDDDTIPVQHDVIIRLQQYLDKGFYGYGANRLWTPDLQWIESHKMMLSDITKQGNLSRLKEFSGIPQAEIRLKNDNSVRMLLKSFIGNFGLISKRDFINVGGFPDFPGYACEDDALSFLCYLKFGRPIIFNDIELIHISHPLIPKARSDIVANQQRLQQLLKDNGCSEFHISRLLFQTDGDIVK